MTPFIKEKECFLFNDDRKKSLFYKTYNFKLWVSFQIWGFFIIYDFIFQNKINTRSASWYSDYVGLPPT